MTSDDTLPEALHYHQLRNPIAGLLESRLLQAGREAVPDGWTCGIPRLSVTLNRSAMDLLIPPPVVFAIVAAAMWLISRAVGAASIDSGLQAPVAIALSIAGTSVMAMAVASFVAAKTTINPLKPARASRLITGGAFRFTRNPIYLGDLLILAAIAVWLGQPANLALLAGFAWYIDRFQIRPEERVLSALFGAEYAAYCARVRRWL